MPIALEINSRKFVKSLKTIPRKEKIFIAESIENDLLSEWDNYEETPDVSNRVNEALLAYKNKEVVNLRDIK
ncbi:MAG: hypothetical protein NT007_04010 [Candidatus Kapabacteria bacterium]|nr:hypothetical protein [Candidatus Kapabacteria bacterium]